MPAPSLRILILGGTGEAIALAGELVEVGHHVVTSLAGVTREPRQPAGEVKSGSLGGVEGLARTLNDENFQVLIDVTHPFASRISANAYEAASQCGVKIFRLERPGWTQELGDRWLPVASIAEAVKILPPQSHVFLTTGRKDLASFMERDDISGVARMIDPPAVPLRTGWQLVLSRPPHAQSDEEAMMLTHHISHLVSKNAGGEATRAKLLAARQLCLPVVMIERPYKPAVETFPSVAEICNRLGTLFCA